MLGNYSSLRRLSILSIALLISALCSSPVVASYPKDFQMQVQQYPDIISESRTRCTPLKGHYNSAENYVCDPNRLLTVDDINSINARIAEIRTSINRDSMEACSVDKPRPTIAIALVNELNIGGFKKSEEVLNYAAVFTYYLFEEWKLPSPCEALSDKIIIFYSKKDGSLYTYAGTLLNQRLPTKTIVRVAVASKPFFGLSVASGLKYVLERYKNILMGRDKGLLSN